MKKPQLASITRAVNASRRAWIFGAALAVAGIGTAHAASTEIQVWHTLTGANKTEFEKLVKQFNKEQDDVEVALRAFPTASSLKQEANASIRAKRAPNLIQLDDNHSPEVVAEHAAIKPMYELLAKYPIKDANWFLPGTTSFVRDAKGRLLAFPWMAEIPVMFYNIDYYKKAGLNPAQPPRTWADLQGHLLKVRDVANIDCPYATSSQVMVHIENLAPVNNQELTTNGNGLVTGKTPFGMQFDTLYMRHLSLMVSWVRSQVLTNYANDRGPDALFAKGECAVLTTGSGALGQFLATNGLKFGVAPLPYYEQATQTAGRPFISGAALWAVDGQPAEKDKATAQFLAWLSKPVVAAEWHQRTGYLPLTEAAFRASDVSFYDRMPGAQQIVASMRAQPSASGRGFRIANYERIESAFNQQLEDAFAGRTPPVAALNNAASQARLIAQQK